MRVLKTVLAIGIIAWVTFANVDIGVAAFPDEIFREYVSMNFDKNSDGILTDAEIAAVKIIAVSSKGIESLKGIEYFTALTQLHCQSNQLTSLDVSLNIALTSLSCYSNELTALDVSNNTALTYLSCHANQLAELDVSLNTALTYLNCKENYIPEAELPAKPDGISQSSWTTLPQNSIVVVNVDNFPDENFRNWILAQNYGNGDDVLSTAEVAAITTIDVSNKMISDLTGIEYFTALKTLTCSNNLLTEFGLSANAALRYLNCSGNELASIDVSKNVLLENLTCNTNQLTELDVSENTALIALLCNSNQLTALDLSNNAVLEVLSCSGNELESIDLSNNTALTSLVCSDNKFTELDVSNNTALTYLTCSGNKLTELDVSNNTALEYLTCDGNYIPEADVPAKPADLDDAAWITLPQNKDISPINKTQKSDSRYGIRFAQNIVNTTAEISVVLPNNDKAVKTEIIVYDMTGNVVYSTTGNGRIVWNLTNSAGRIVANGTYLVIAEVKAQNGMSYHYSAKLGVKR